VHSIHNCWPMCRCDCAAVEHRPNPDPQALFILCMQLHEWNFLSAYCVPAACCQISKQRCQISFLTLVLRNCKLPLPFARLLVQYTVSEGLTSAIKMDVAVLSKTVLNIYRTDITQSRLALLFSEDGGSTLLRNVGNYESIRCHISYDLIVDRITLRLRI
jgi:hypothetical protein